MFGNKTISLAIIAAGQLQATVVLLQALNLLPSFSAWFSISGTFPNPSHAACLITFAMAIITAMLFEQSIKWSLATPILLFDLVSLCLCATRSCFIALVIVILYCLYKTYSVKGKRQLLFILVALACISIVSLSLYMIRPESADSRLLIWRVCYDIFQESPIYGIGCGNLKYEYMYHQAEYFKWHPDSIWANIANNNHQAFNEYIHILCENGIIGLLLALVFFSAIFRKANLQEQATLLSFFVISFFLYTLAIIPVVVEIGLLIASIVSPRLRNVSTWTEIPILVIIMVAPPIIMTYDISHISDSQCHVPVPTYESVCEEGLKLQQAGDFEEAGEQFELAKRMIPCRIFASYCLFKLYVETGNPMAEQEAMLLLNQDVRVIGDATIRMRADVREWLKSNPLNK